MNCGEEIHVNFPGQQEVLVIAYIQKSWRRLHYACRPIRDPLVLDQRTHDDPWLLLGEVRPEVNGQRRLFPTYAEANGVFLAGSDLRHAESRFFGHERDQRDDSRRFDSNLLIVEHFECVYLTFSLVGIALVGHHSCGIRGM